MAIKVAFTALFLCGLLAGCATADPVSFANGQPGYSIRCDLGLNGLDQCFREAGDICLDRGYVLRDWQGQPVSISSVEQNVDINFGTFAAKSILVQCKP